PFVPHGLALPSVRPFTALPPLIWPWLTPRSILDQPLKGRRPFRREARSPPIRTLAFPARPPDLQGHSFGQRGFAVACPLAPSSPASYPVSVRRPAGSFPASSRAALTSVALRFPLCPCDLVPGGLSPPSQRPCWAYKHDEDGIAPVLALEPNRDYWPAVRTSVRAAVLP